MERKRRKRIMPSLVSTTSTPARKPFVRTHYVRTNIKSVNVRRYTEHEIINTLIGHLEVIFGGVGSPKMKDIMREVASIMTHPALFLFASDNGEEDSETASEGLCGYGGSGSVLSLNNLAQKMVYRFRDKVKTAEKRDQPAELDDEVPKKGKRKEHYGVDNVRFLGRKINADSIRAISRTSEEEDLEAREAVYENNRAEIQYQFRNSSKNIHQICKAFFENPMHLTNHFMYITRSEDLTEKVKNNLEVQIGYLERFLLGTDSSVEMKDKLARVQTMCDVEYLGSTLFKDINILRLTGDILDSDGSSLVRIEDDGPVGHAGPFILAIEVNKTFVFELLCEQKLILRNLDMSQAIASFLHLSFVFDLKYPQASQTLADIMQRQMAK